MRARENKKLCKKEIMEKKKKSWKKKEIMGISHGLYGSNVYMVIAI